MVFCPALCASPIRTLLGVAVMMQLVSQAKGVCFLMGCFCSFSCRAPALWLWLRAFFLVSPNP